MASLLSDLIPSDLASLQPQPWPYWSCIISNNFFHSINSYFNHPIRSSRCPSRCPSLEHPSFGTLILKTLCHSLKEKRTLPITCPHQPLVVRDPLQPLLFCGLTLYSVISTCPTLNLVGCTSLLILFFESYGWQLIVAKHTTRCLCSYSFHDHTP